MIIEDIKIPFWSLVVLMVKVAFAIIPALIIIMFAATAITAFVTGMFV